MLKDYGLEVQKLFLEMTQNIIDNIDNYTFEIINGSLILTPKNSIAYNIACNIIKVDKTILINDVARRRQLCACAEHLQSRDL